MRALCLPLIFVASLAQATPVTVTESGSDGQAASSSDPTHAADAQTYICADGTTLTVKHGTEYDQPAVNLTYKGEAFILLAEPSETGARYGWPSDGSNNVWLEDAAGVATLLWKDGEKGGQETVLHSGCTTK